MANSFLVSIIVPIYKAEKTLSKCVESIQTQSYKNLEIILVNDGSPDRSGEICEKYAINDKRIKVIHQENKGVGHARQAGIELAQGEYITFLDSDDWIETDNIELLVETAKKEDADIVFCDFVTEDPDGTHYIKQIFNHLDCREMIENTLLFYRVWPNLGAKLIRRKLIVDNNINFSPYLKYGEDTLFICRLYRLNCKLAYLPKSFYHYEVTNTNSVTHSVSKKSLQNRIQAIQFIQSEFNDIDEKFFYDLKSEFLYTAFQSGNYDMLEHFREIHPVIIGKGTPYNFKIPISSNFALAIKGCPRIAKFTLSINLAVIKFFQKLKKNNDGSQN